MMYARSTRIWPLMWLLGLGFMMSGCGASSRGDQAQRGDEQHLEHHVPAHKPRNVLSAWPDLKQRLEGLKESSPPLELTELRDIFGWLPELAGDTDLKRPAWEQIQSFSVRALSQSSSLTDALGHRDNLLSELSGLEPLLVDVGRTSAFDLRDEQTSSEAATLAEETIHD